MPVQPANGVIIHPGAIGDCLLTLPLAAYMKLTLGLSTLDFIGRMDYIEFYPGRTCIDRVRSLESIEMHRLFAMESEFLPQDGDRLINAFESYDHIVSFLGHGHPDFEKNMLFCVNCTHSAEVTVLPLAPTADDERHVSVFYQQEFARAFDIDEDLSESCQSVFPLPSDFAAGQNLLEDAEIDADKPVIFIQPGSGARDKCWHLQNFLYTASALAATGIEPVFLLGPSEQERFSKDDLRLIDEWPILSNLSLTQVLQVLTQTELYLGNDSGISHLAGAMGKKTVVLFGPAGKAAHYRPMGKGVTIIEPVEQSFTEMIKPEAEQIVQTVTKKVACDSD